MRSCTLSVERPVSRFHLRHPELLCGFPLPNVEVESAWFLGSSMFNPLQIGGFHGIPTSMLVAGGACSFRSRQRARHVSQPTQRASQSGRISSLSAASADVLSLGSLAPREKRIGDNMRQLSCFWMKTSMDQPIDTPHFEGVR